MRMIAIHAQTERKRLDRSVRCAEKRRPWARKQRLRGLIRPDPAVCATAGAACGRKSLSSARIQAIFTSNDTPLGECRSATLIASGRSSSATRIMRYYSADGLERPMDFSCQIGQAPNAGVMVEACAGHGIRFENSYLPSAGVSRQWIGPGLGYVTIQVLRD